MEYGREEIVRFLGGERQDELFALSSRLRRENVGEGVYMWGLIEYSNVCRKDCYYCGIRRSGRIDRYTLTREQVIEAAKFAHSNRYGSVVIQAGEQCSEVHTATIESLIREIKDLSGGELGITLSLGEQSAATYRRWFAAGAHRYLLRIESSDPQLYARLHPDDGLHRYEDRRKAINDLRDEGYQVGTGVMIGLPFQTLETLADDLLFMVEQDIDMCGMGPYVVSRETPLARYADLVPSESERVLLSLRMVAMLRVLMPDINIAATTALQALDPQARMRVVEIGANVVMPNLSPEELRPGYMLYDNKPISFDSRLLERHLRFGEWGDSRHFAKRSEKQDGKV